MVRCNRAGISRLVVGHTPHGNCPTVIKTAEHDAHLEVMTLIASDCPLMAL